MLSLSKSFSLRMKSLFRNIDVLPSVTMSMDVYKRTCECVASGYECEHVDHFGIICLTEPGVFGNKYCCDLQQKPCDIEESTCPTSLPSMFC